MPDYTIVRRPKGKHAHHTPLAFGEVMPGTVVRCSCGARLLLVEYNDASRAWRVLRPWYLGWWRSLVPAVTPAGPLLILLGGMLLALSAVLR